MHGGPLPFTGRRPTCSRLISASNAYGPPWPTTTECSATVYGRRANWKRGNWNVTARASKARYGARCVVCRGNIAPGDRYVDYAGFWRHPHCTPDRIKGERRGA